MNFLEFIFNKKENNKNKEIFLESFKKSDKDKAIKKILDLLKKQTGETIVSLGYFDMNIGENQCTSELFVLKNVKNQICFTFNWMNSEKSDIIYSISFFKNMNVFFDGQGKSDLTIETFGSSIVYFIPLIAYIIDTKDFNLKKEEVSKFIKNIFSDKIKESIQWPCQIDDMTYIVYEGLSENLVKETFRYNIENNVFESAYSDLIQWKLEKFAKFQNAKMNQYNSEEDNKEYEKIKAEYEEIKKAIDNGAQSIDEVKLAIKKSLEVKLNPDKAEEEFNSMFKKSKKDPEQTFKEMEKYVKMVIKGITPSVILCGAPGVGKTYRVKTLLKDANYKEGQNLCTIKGKCTPRILYLRLLEYKNKGDIIVIDDADGLVGPKAPEEVINILKAALDSTSDENGKLVTYEIAGPLKDDDGNNVAKKFYYNGGVIVITNYNAGQLDTALRGRSFIQDIHFSVDDVLHIIEKLLPKLSEGNLSNVAKLKAFDYLKKMAKNKSKMEISIRTFIICAKIFEACDNDDDFTDEDAQSMIEEQMKLQADRGGQKY